MAAISVTLFKEKETKNTIRFSEPVGPDEDPKIGVLYVPKTTLAEIGATESITVTVSA